MAEAEGGIKSVLRYAAAWVAEHWIEIIVGAATLAVTTIARFSKLLAPYGALGWVAAGLATLAVLAVIYGIFSWAANRGAEARYKRILADMPRTVNADATNFDHQRINIADFFHPLSPVHKGKTFRNCTLIGPGSLLFMNHTNIFEPRMTACDFVAVKGNAKIHAAVGFEECSFHQCGFINLTVFIPIHMAETMMQAPSDTPTQIFGYNV